MRIRSTFILIAIALFAFAGSSSAQITIDGVMFDWDESMRLDVAPNSTSLFFEEGDTLAPKKEDLSFKRSLDIGPIYATDDPENLYVRIRLNPQADVTTIANDTSIHGGATFYIFMTMDPDSNIADTSSGLRRDSTGLRYSGYWASAFEHFVQLFPKDSAAEANTDGQQYVWQHSGIGEWGWSTMQESVADTTIGVLVAWNGDNNEVECAIPKSVLAFPKYMNPPSMQKGDSLGMMFHFQENFAPWWGNIVCNGKQGWAMGATYGMIYKWQHTATVVGVGEEKNLPKQYSLSQNYPNPFNPETAIAYELPVSGFVSLKVYNTLGKEVANLVGENQQAGKHTVTFNAGSLSSGIYFYSLEAGTFSKTNKMIILK